MFTIPVLNFNAAVQRKRKRVHVHQISAILQLDLRHPKLVIDFGTLMKGCRSVDAIVHDRPYHRAMAFPIAREEILRRAGIHFDPELVEPAIAHLEKYLETPRSL